MAIIMSINLLKNEAYLLRNTVEKICSKENINLDLLPPPVILADNSEVWKTEEICGLLGVS